MNAILWTWAVTATAIALALGLAAAGWRRRAIETAERADVERGQLQRLVAHAWRERDALGAMCADAEERLAAIASVVRRVPRRRWLATARRIARAAQGEVFNPHDVDPIEGEMFVG